MSDEEQEFIPAPLAVAHKQLEIISPESIPDMDKMETGVSLQVEYMEFNTPGQTVRCIFLGFTPMASKRNVQGEEVEVMIQNANFQDKTGVFSNAGANLVKQLQNVKPGTPVQVTFLGQEKAKSGFKFNKFDVRILSKANALQPVSTQPIRQAPVAPTAAPARAPQNNRPAAPQPRTAQPAANTRPRPVAQPVQPPPDLEPPAWADDVPNEQMTEDKVPF